MKNSKGMAQSDDGSKLNILRIVVDSNLI